MYGDNNITNAGLLCSARISDTLMFRSPIFTSLNKYEAKKTAKIAGTDLTEPAQEMFRAGSSLADKSAE